PDLWRAGSLDVVFCRNLIMYLTPPCAQALIARISAALAPGGYLFLGHAETLRGLSQDFHLRHTHDTFYYQRKEAAATAPAAPPKAPRAGPDLGGAGEASWIETIQRASERIQALAEGPTPAPQAPLSSLRPTWDLGLVEGLL